LNWVSRTNAPIETLALRRRAGVALTYRIHLVCRDLLAGNVKARGTKKWITLSTKCGRWVLRWLSDGCDRVRRKSRKTGVVDCDRFISDPQHHLGCLSSNLRSLSSEAEVAGRTGFFWPFNRGVELLEGMFASLARFSSAATPSLLSWCFDDSLLGILAA
jgi:hypothetical protein